MKSFLEWMDIIEEGSKKEQLELEKLMMDAGFVKSRSKKENQWEKEVEGLGWVSTSVSKQPNIPAKHAFKTAMTNFENNVAERRRIQEKRAEQEAAKRKKKK